MPTIQSASVPVHVFPNEYFSPSGDETIIPIYSSIPLKTQTANCLPCVVCGNYIVRSSVLENCPNSPSGQSWGTLQGNTITITPNI
jgi:hypothetical protein